MISPSILRIVETSIFATVNEYKRMKGVILTESDLKCLIYSKLRAKLLSPFINKGNGLRSIREDCSSNPYSLELSWKMMTRDEGILTSPLHTEVAWFDRDHQLTIRPDITLLLNPEKLSIIHGLENNDELPSKEYAFEGEAILIELKFIRNQTGITTGVCNGVIKKDLKKITRLKEKLDLDGASNSIYCYFLIFNKTETVCPAFDKFMMEQSESSWYKVIYASGKVSFPPLHRRS